MITIYKPNGYHKGEILRRIPNDDFFKLLTAKELMKAHPEFDFETSNWSFFPSPDIIIMYTGDPSKITYIPITRSVDVNQFKKSWYLSYCECHGYSYTVLYPSGGIELKKATSQNNRVGRR